MVLDAGRHVWRVGIMVRRTYVLRWGQTVMRHAVDGRVTTLMAMVHVVRRWRLRSVGRMHLLVRPWLSRRGRSALLHGVVRV